MSQAIDERGNVFGRFNLIDLAAIVVVAVLIPMGYVAWRIFRQPAPIITSVTPSTLSVDSPRRVRLHGQHFRPFLNAFVAPANQPYSIPQRVPETVQAIFLIETPTVVELRLPDVPPGTYDIYLYDEGREVARQTAAVTLTPGARPPVVRLGDPVPDFAIVDFYVRFDVDNEIAPLVKPDAVDLNKPDNDHPATTPARLMSIRKVSDAERDVGLRLAPGGGLAASIAAPRIVVEAVVRAGVTQDHGVWTYQGAQRIRAGEGFAFGTADYRIYGLITRIAATRAVKP